jgi:signal transduction histidine kinase
MSLKPKPPEREQTDESLRAERQRTDRELESRQADLEEDADRLVRQARDTADAVLGAARDKADEAHGEAATARPRPSVVAEERRVEDRALTEERASADAALREQREENARILSGLLPLEREKTDRFLLTERVRSDEALSHRDDFLGIVSHDLRNLLGGIVMSAGLLAENAKPDEDGERIVAATERIQRYTARMNRLVGDLVDVASVDTGKLAVEPVHGGLREVIAEAFETFSPSAAKKGLSLEMADGEHPLEATFDHERIHQVLANLITNSIKFTPAGGSIVVAGHRAGEEVRCSVTDTGSGIPRDMLEAVFERFWQVGKSDRRGVGLGLYISRCIVEAHGGAIWAESELGKGSTFSFTLRAPAAGESPQAPA